MSPRGTCALLDANGGCTVHERKPKECASLLHDEPTEKSRGVHNDVAHTWDNPEAQALVRELYGKEPRVEDAAEGESSIFDLLLGGFGGSSS